MSGNDVYWRFVHWRSKDGGPWEEIEIGPRSIVAWNLSQIRPGEIYDDGYGNRYRYERVDLK